MTKTIGGTVKVPLTEGLLDLIIMVQNYKQFKLSQSMFSRNHGGEPINWERETENFFNSIDPKILEKYSLSTNKISFEKVMDYRITDEMRSTSYEELRKKFTF